MGEQKSILIVDDDTDTARTLALIFGGEGYEATTANSGREALQKTKERFFNLVLLDIRLPDIDGTKLLETLTKTRPEMMIIMITAYATVETAVQSMRWGVQAYITKPFDVNHVLTTTSEALEKQRLVMENSRLYDEAQHELAERKQAEKQTKQYSRRLQVMIEDITKAIALTTELRDPYTSGHQQRVTQLACAITKAMGYNKDAIAEMRVAGSLHDIGKMYVPSDILTRPGKLSEMEFNMIKTHARAGHDILKTVRFPWRVAPIVLQHHERMNGSGYPSGLSAKEILLESRILSVADVVEAIASHRPYRPALGIDKALEEISRYKGPLYDAAVVDVCLRLFSTQEFQFQV